MTKIKLAFLFACTALMLGLANNASVHAESLRLAPLTFEDDIEGEKKKGFVDIANPTANAVSVTIEIQAFRQINDRGELEFYDDPLVSAGITPDLRSFELGPRESVRMYFGIDSQKLPKGRVFAGLFARSLSPGASLSGTTTSTRVGTLLMLQNGTKGKEVGEFAGSLIPIVHIGEGIRGAVVYKNTGTGEDATGYFPVFSIAATPWGPESSQKGSLVFPGIQRTTNFDLQGDYVGVYRLVVRAGGDSVSQHIIVVTGYWRWLLPLIVTASGFSILLCGIYLKKRRFSKRVSQ
jgi:hypothetical protein